MAPAKRKKRDACVPGQEEVPRSGRETPGFPEPPKWLGELAWGFGEGPLCCPSPPKPPQMQVPVLPPQCQKSKLWLLRPLGFSPVVRGSAPGSSPPPLPHPHPHPPVICLTCRLWAGPGPLIFHSCTSSQDYSSQVGILGRFEMEGWGRVLLDSGNRLLETG